MVVQHNLRAMNSNRMLGLTASVQSKSTEKLSSGYKINRAADDAAGLSISEKMRKQIRGLSQASLNAADGISAVQTAEGALNEVQDMLQRMNELAVKAANGTMSEDDRGYIQDEIDQLVTEIDRVAETTKFNETYLLKGDNTKTSTVYSYVSEDIKLTDKDGQEVALFDICGSAISASVAKEKLDAGETLYKDAGDHAAFTSADHIKDDTHVKLTASLYDAQGDEVYKSGDILAVGVDTSKLYTDKAGATAAGATAGAVTGKEAVNVTTVDIFNADGTIAWKKDSVVAADKATAAVQKKYYSKAELGEKAVEGEDYIFTKGNLYDKDGNGIAANGLESYFKTNELGETVYKGGLYDSNGNAVGTVGSKVAEDDELKSFIATKEDGQGALSFKLHVGADATSNNQIQLEISAMDAQTLGIKDVNVETEKDALSTIETVKAAIQKVSTQRSALGAIQNRLEHTINNLDNVVENTTAAESQIRDTDMATEMVKFSNNNILAQAGQAMLAQANQANQGVLSLLG